MNIKKYQQLLQEETRRYRKLIFEYNESEIWSDLSIEDRESILLAIDDDKGPDFADEYAEEDWLKIPDVIKNYIDLSVYKKKNDVSTIDRDAWTYMRGTLYIITDDERYSNTAEMQKMIANKIGSKNNIEDIKKQIITYAADNGTGAIMNLNRDTQRMSKEKDPIFKEPTDGFAPGVDPLAAIRRPGSNWTGD
jgi:hypothetical protein